MSQHKRLQETHKAQLYWFGDSRRARARREQQELRKRGARNAEAADPAAEYGDGGGRMLSIVVVVADGGAGTGRGTEADNGFNEAERLREFSRPKPLKGNTKLPNFTICWRPIWGLFRVPFSGSPHFPP